MSVLIVGRFPPRNDRLTLATRRMSEIVALRHRVSRIDIEPAASQFVENEVQSRWRRVLHYMKMRSRICSEVSRSPGAPVLWASISPAPLGHFRDVATVASAFAPDQPVAGIVHRAGYDRLFRSPVTKPTALRLALRLAAFVFLNDCLSHAYENLIPGSRRFVITNTVDRDVLFSESEIDEKRRDRRRIASVRLLFLSNMIRKKKECDRRADVFVLPTYYPTEAQPVALIEATNAGATDHHNQAGRHPIDAVGG